MSINIEISLGEFWDKVTILQIKAERITETGKLQNINKELNQLMQQWQESSYSKCKIDGELEDLRQINEQLWDIEDDIRDKERTQQFDSGFISLARSVYFKNDKRAGIKSRINKKLGSAFAEEKSYKEYSAD